MVLLRVGTSSWSHEDWRGTVYPETAKPGEFLRHYAEKYSTVEIDATWYRIPSETLVKKWERDAPPGFVFAAKVPSVITHEKMLEGAEPEMNEFLRAMDHLGDKLGPLCFQFSYAFKPDKFEVLDAFLAKLPKDHKFAVEVRDKKWLTDRFYDMLRARGVALVLLDLLWMPRMDVLTTDWTYLRFIGDRKGIEKKTTSWDKVIVDRSKEMAWWTPKIAAFFEKRVPMWVYFNNHFAGHAPGSIALFLETLRRSGLDPG